MLKERKSSKDVLANIPHHYFQAKVPNDYNPAIISWVTDSIGITAWDGVQDALEQGFFVINVADEIDNQADAKIPVDPGSGTVLMCLDDIQELIEDTLEEKKRKVVVHCAMGMERSVLSVVWYLHQNANMSLDDAYDLVRKFRPIALDHQNWIYS